MMLKLHFNGVRLQAFNFIHGFQRLLLHSTSSSSSTLVDSPSSSSSSSLSTYLEQNLGFSRQQSLSTLTKLSNRRTLSGTKNKVSQRHLTLVNNANLVVNFLKQIDFDQTLITKVINLFPRILLSNVQKTLKPKIELLQGIGLYGSDLSCVISTNPRLLFLRLNIVIETLRQSMGDDENVVKGLKLCYLTRYSVKHLSSNVQLLRKYGIPNDVIQNHIVKDLTPFLLKNRKLEDVLIRVEKELGIPRDVSMFLYGVRILARYNEKKVKSKFDIYKSFGWNQSEFLALLRSNPLCLGFSDTMIKKKLDFLMGELSFSPSYLASYCGLFTYSLEKRIIPRYKLLLVLKAKGSIRMDYPLINFVSLKESWFVNKFVLPFEEVHELYAELVGCSVKLKNRKGDHS